MNDKTIRWVGRLTLALGALGAAGAWFWRGWSAVGGVAVGALLFYGNLLVLQALGRKLLLEAEGPKRGTVGLMLVKFLLLIGVIFAITRFVPLDVLAFMGGVSAGVLAILLASLIGPPQVQVDEDETGGGAAGME